MCKKIKVLIFSLGYLMLLASTAQAVHAHLFVPLGGTVPDSPEGSTTRRVSLTAAIEMASPWYIVFVFVPRPEEGINPNNQIGPDRRLNRHPRKGVRFMLVVDGHEHREITFPGLIEWLTAQGFAFEGPIAAPVVAPAAALAYW
jgi:hypothetical protein